MSFGEIALRRTSVRKYKPDEVPEYVLSRVLDAGRIAPSARNWQSWKFVVVRDEAIREKMFDACNQQPSMKTAPVHLVICGNEDANMACGQSHVTVDCSIALTYIMLQAAEEGLGTCWLGNFNADKVREACNIPDDYVIVAVTPLGWPDETNAQRPRKAFNEVVVYDHF